MKAKFNTKTLFAALNRFSGICGSNSAVHTTEGIKIDCSQNERANTAILSGTNLRITLQVDLECEVLEAGLVIVPWKLLTDTVKAANTEMLVLTADGTSATLAGKGKYKMPVLAAAQFPNVEIPDAVELTLEADDFRCIEKCLPFVANDDLRPAMTGVNLSVDSDGNYYCGTDANRLCVARTAGISETEFTAVLPAELCRLLKSAMGVVQIGQTERELIATGLGWRVKVAKIDARYPQYRLAIPQANPYRLTVDKKAFILALKRVGIYSDTITHAVDLRLTEGKEMWISGTDMNYDLQAEETLPCTYSGDDLTIRFNAKFLASVCSAVSGDELEFEIGDPHRAVLLNDGNSLLVVMPLFVG